MSGESKARASGMACKHRQYNGDLMTLCESVNQADLRLPDGRRLLFAIKGVSRPILDVQKRRVA